MVEGLLFAPRARQHITRPTCRLRFNSSGSLAIFVAIRRASSLLSSLAVSRYSFEVKVYADNAALALCNSAKNLSYWAEGADVYD
jgi:TnpA family transposase